MDTAQPFTAAETDPVQSAADAFKIATNPDAARPRDENGRYASNKAEAEEAEPEEAEVETPLEAEAEGEELEEAEDPELEEGDNEEAEEAHPMPTSWPDDMADQWSQLPAEAQGVIAEREAERDRAVNAKFQESANARKAAAEAAQEAQAKRDELTQRIDMVESLYRSPEPDPRAFGYGTQQYNEAGYRAAVQQWQQTEQTLAQLTEQRDSARKEAEEAETKEFQEWFGQHEETYRPKLLNDVPELADPAKGGEVAKSLVEYAQAQGIPEETFAGENAQRVTSAELHILWKAQQFDKLSTKSSKPKPKPAGPAVKPGVSSPRSAQKAARKQKAWNRLDREGSIEAGAAIFKDFM